MSGGPPDMDMAADINLWLQSDPALTPDTINFTLSTLPIFSGASLLLSSRMDSTTAEKSSPSETSGKRWFDDSNDSRGSSKWKISVPSILMGDCDSQLTVSVLSVAFAKMF